MASAAGRGIVAGVLLAAPGLDHRRERAYCLLVLLGADGHGSGRTDPDRLVTGVRAPSPRGRCVGSTVRLRPARCASHRTPTKPMMVTTSPARMSVATSQRVASTLSRLVRSRPGRPLEPMVGGRIVAGTGVRLVHGQ
jgi:hypothetical protein